jgi:hypothetical protein
VQPSNMLPSSFAPLVKVVSAKLVRLVQPMNMLEVLIFVAVVEVLITGAVRNFTQPWKKLPKLKTFGRLSVPTDSRFGQ